MWDAGKGCVRHREIFLVGHVVVPLQWNVIDIFEVRPVEKLLNRFVTSLESAGMNATHGNDVGQAEQGIWEKSCRKLKLTGTGQMMANGDARGG